MALPFNLFLILYIIFIYLRTCYGFVAISTDVGRDGEINVFSVGESITYQLNSVVQLYEKAINPKKVGFKLEGSVVIETVWGNNGKKLFKIQLNSPQLNIKSRKAPSLDDFIPHYSSLESSSNKPFLVAWDKGIVENIFIAKDESLSLVNLKKGIASLMQFQVVSGDYLETDSMGKCSVYYNYLSPLEIYKRKGNCLQNLPYIKTPDKILGAKIESERGVTYELDDKYSYFKSIKTEELHGIYLASQQDIANFVEVKQILNFVERGSTKTVAGIDIDDVIKKISKNEGVTYSQETLWTKREQITNEGVISFSKQVDNLRHYLISENLGILKPVKAFVLLVNTGRTSSKADILKALESKGNKIILPQLYDTLGYVQTKESHEAVMKKLHFDKETHMDLSERYLWALSFSSQPNPDIIRDLIKKYKKPIIIPQKVKDTLILTIASMTRRLTKLQKDNYLNLVRIVEELIINNLEYAKETARDVFFEALKNLQSKSSIPTLLKFINNGTSRETMLSFKSIQTLDSGLWNQDVTKAAEKALFQLDKKYDSTARTLAADILLESNPSDELLEHLLKFVVSNETAFEIKQYVFQRIKMKAEECASFGHRIQHIIKKNSYINNYSGLSPRGLSTALMRHFMKSNSTNGKLVSIQEIKSGIVKRGAVNVVLYNDEDYNELFSLGIFSGGLSSLMSSNNEEGEEVEKTTAGMELTVLGTQIRPFVFFEGQGELMGHVWSGTASEKTSAFQALTLLGDHLEYIRLGSGLIVELNLKVATSFDLSGKIEISLWNRNANSVIEKSAGILVLGSTKIDTSFIKSQLEFNASLEPKLELQTDIDFSSDVCLCMRLTQPDSLFKYNVFKTEHIPGTLPHKLRISKYANYTVSGKTYYINRKNNDMCNTIFS